MVTVALVLLATFVSGELTILSHKGEITKNSFFACKCSSTGSMNDLGLTNATVMAYNGPRTAPCTLDTLDAAVVAPNNNTVLVVTAHPCFNEQLMVTAAQRGFAAVVIAYELRIDNAYTFHRCNSMWQTQEKRKGSNSIPVYVISLANKEHLQWSRLSVVNDTSSWNSILVAWSVVGLCLAVPKMIFTLIVLYFHVSFYHSCKTPSVQVLVAELIVDCLGIMVYSDFMSVFQRSNYPFIMLTTSLLIVVETVSSFILANVMTSILLEVTKGKKGQVIKWRHITYQTLYVIYILLYVLSNAFNGFFVGVTSILALLAAASHAAFQIYFACYFIYAKREILRAQLNGGGGSKKQMQKVAWQTTMLQLSSIFLFMSTMCGLGTLVSVIKGNGVALWTWWSLAMLSSLLVGIIQTISLTLPKKKDSKPPRSQSSPSRSKDKDKYQGSASKPKASSSHRHLKGSVSQPKGSIHIGSTESQRQQGSRTTELSMKRSTPQTRDVESVDSIGSSANPTNSASPRNSSLP